MSNVEQGLPAFGGAKGDQGISNDEVQLLLLFPSAFVIRYSAVRFSSSTQLVKKSLTETLANPFVYKLWA
jgi:hypothetical protein